MQAGAVAFVAPQAVATSSKPSVSKLSLTSDFTTGGRTVLISGKNFTKSSKVYFGTFRAAKTKYANSKKITATVPPSTKAGAVYVTVRTSGGTSAKSSKSKFTYRLQTNLGTDTLRAGQRMERTQYLRSKADKFRLVMQGDGNLVLRKTSGEVVWAVSKPGAAFLGIQNDGNVVVRDSQNNPLWASGTDGFDNAALVVQDDGNLVLYSAGVPIWTHNSGYLADRWRPGVTLPAGGTLKSGNRRLALIMQGDGNLVLYDGGKARWASGTSGDNYAVMQGDGNAVVYRRGGGALWASSTGSFGGASMALQNDGNAVIYYANLPVWSNGVYLGDRLSPGQTMRAGDLRKSADKRFTLAMQGDGNLVLYDGSKSVWATDTGGDNRAEMQGDGNLVVYRNGGGPLWDSKTAGKNGSFLAVQNDGNLVLYQGGTAVWSRHGVGGVRGDDYPSNLRNAPQDSIVDPWRFYNRECTSFVAWRMNNANGVGFSNFMVGPNGKSGRFGNADNWAANARAIGYRVDNTPAVGSIAWWSSNHVAWVAKVNGDGTIVIEEYNYGYNGRYNSRTIPANQPSGFIHVKDL